MFACVLSCLFFPLYFVCCLLHIFSVLPTKIAEEGTKGNMSDLDAPDASTAVPGDERSASRFFADEEYFLCTSVSYLIAFEMISLSWLSELIYMVVLKSVYLGHNFCGSENRKKYLT